MSGNSRLEEIRFFKFSTIEGYGVFGIQFVINFEQPTMAFFCSYSSIYIFQDILGNNEISNGIILNFNSLYIFIAFSGGTIQ